MTMVNMKATTKPRSKAPALDDLREVDRTGAGPVTASTKWICGKPAISDSA